MYICQNCKKEFKEYNSLRVHSVRVHKINSKLCYIKYKLNGVVPICKCGCGQQTKFYCDKNDGPKFREYIAGHQSRVHNNWGHNKKAIENSSKTRREQFASGERIVWNSGLTKEVDNRVKNYGINRSLSFTDEDKKEYSLRMSKMRRDGTIPTLYKEQSSRWKGGVSTIQQVARSYKRLYDEWKYPILESAGFKCIKCNSSKDLHVHHNKETFSEIIKKVMTIEDYELIEDFDRKKLICDKIVDYHVNNKVSGECLCFDCHKKHHPSLNFV